MAMIDRRKLARIEKPNVRLGARKESGADFGFHSLRIEFLIIDVDVGVRLCELVDIVLPELRIGF